VAAGKTSDKKEFALPGNCGNLQINVSLPEGMIEAERCLLG
jgi:hypothetical protein